MPETTTTTTTVTSTSGAATTVTTPTTTTIAAPLGTGRATGEGRSELVRSEERSPVALARAERAPAAASEVRAVGASFGCVGLGVWTYDPARRVGTWSEEVSRLLEHLPSAGPPGWGAMLARLHAEDAVQLADAVDATGGGAGFGMDLRVATQQREARWVHVFVRVDRDPEGRLTWLEGFVTDVSARKRVEFQQRRLAEIAPRSDNLVLLTGVDGRIEWVNPACVKRTEYSFDELFGRRPADLLQGPASDATVIAEMSAALRARRTFSGEIVNYSKSGKQYWVALTIQPLLGELGEHTGFMAIQSDVTSRKLAEQARELEHEVAATLLQSASLAEAADDLLRTITTVLKVASAQLWRVEHGAEELVYVAGFGANPLAKSFVAVTRELGFRAGTVFGEVGVGAPGLAWGTRRSQVVREVRGTSRRSDAARAAGIVTVISVPILIPDGVLGVLELGGAALYPGHEELPEQLEQLCRRLAEFELRSLERRRFETIFERSPDGVLLVSPSGTVMHANAEALRLFQRGIGGRLSDWMEGTARMVEGALSPDSPEVRLPARPVRGVRADGKELHLEVSLAPIVALAPGSSGPAERQVLVTVRDMTEQLQVKTDLARERESRRILEVQKHTIERLVRFSPIPLLLVSMEGRIELVNTAATTLLGRPVEALLGAPMSLLLPSWNQLVKEEMTEQPREVMLLSPEGHLIPADLRTSAFDDGATQSVLLALVDQREHKRIEGAILEALDAAEAATLAKSRFLANMSHELRTPLNVILGMSRVALQRPPSEESHRCLAKVNDEAQHLLRIVSDILDLSKVESGELRLEASPFELEATLGEVVDRFGINAQERGIDLLFEEDGSLPARVIGDPLRFSQIVGNLIGNALKFTERGEVLVSVHARRDGGVARVVCAVRDTGIGMSPETVREIFKAFTQADTSTTRKYGGTGLGLSICKKLCEQMGGEIDVESGLGRGTTVRLEIPFPIDLEATPEVLDARLARLPVLVVSSQPTNRRIASALLRRLGLRAQTAGTAETALAALRTARQGVTPIELMVCDARLSLGDARAFLRQIPVSDRPRGVVIVTAEAESFEPDPSAEPGMGVVRVRGPVRAGPLITALAGLIDGAVETPRVRRVGPRSALAGARVLVVDDHPLNVEIVASILSEQGATVTTAANGAEALDQVANAPLGDDGRPFLLVLMDIQMPKMDGLTAARAIRALSEPDRAGVPIVAMTANAMPDDVTKSLHAGMNGHLTKPIDFDMLRRTVLQWCAPEGQEVTLSN